MPEGIQDQKKTRKLGTYEKRSPGNYSSPDSTPYPEDIGTRLKVSSCAQYKNKGILNCPRRADMLNDLRTFI
jgi:hypothetical protein